MENLGSLSHNRDYWRILYGSRARKDKAMKMFLIYLLGCVTPVVILLIALARTKINAVPNRSHHPVRQIVQWGIEIVRVSDLPLNCAYETANGAHG